MALDIQPIQQKKKHTGFFVLLIIIAVVIFSAYALTKKERQMSSATPGLSLNERQAITEAFKDASAKDLNVAEKKNVTSSVSAAATTKPLTSQEKETISKQFAN